MSEISMNPQTLHFKLTYQLVAVLDKARQRLHVVLKQRYEPDFERFVRANTIVQFRSPKLPAHLCN